MELVEVRQAEYFIAVAEELHFGRAAERLTMSQPPLSQAIIQLERQVGARLLERSSRSVRLTEAGRAFLERCRHLVAASAHAAESVALVTAGVTGTLRIGAVTSAFDELVPAILDRFRTRHPAVDLRVREVDTHAGREALVSRELDVAIIRQASVGRGLETTPLRRDSLVLVVPEGWDGFEEAMPERGSREAAVDLADFRDAAWVWLPRAISPDYHDELASACRDAGFTPEAVHIAHSIHSQLALVGAGLGVTLAPASSVRSTGLRVRPLPLQRPVDLVELSVVRRTGADEPLVDQFLACAESLACAEGSARGG